MSKREQAERNVELALLEMGENRVKVLWGRVVERGAGLNWRFGCVGRWMGVAETVSGLLEG